MTFDYERLKVNVAEKQIKRFGKVVQIITPGTNTGEDYDPVIGEPTEDDVYFLETKWKVSDAQKSLVQVNDILGMISTEGGIVPNQLINTIKIDGEVHQLIIVERLMPGTVKMLFYVVVRK